MKLHMKPVRRGPCKLSAIDDCVHESCYEWLKGMLFSFFSVVVVEL